MAPPLSREGASLWPHSRGPRSGHAPWAGPPSILFFWLQWLASPWPRDSIRDRSKSFLRILQDWRKEPSVSGGTGSYDVFSCCGLSLILPDSSSFRNESSVEKNRKKRKIGGSCCFPFLLKILGNYCRGPITEKFVDTALTPSFDGVTVARFVEMHCLFNCSPVPFSSWAQMNIV